MESVPATLPYAASGSRSGQTIVFLHGAGTSGWMWREQIGHLQEYHCLVPDLPGHGACRKRPWVSLRETAAQVAHIVRKHAHGGVAHLVGLSMGGYVALHLMCMEPGLVDHAVITGITAKPFPLSGPLRWVAYAALPLFKTTLMLRLNGRHLNVPTRRRYDYVRMARMMSRRAYTRLSREIINFRLPEGLKDVSSPTLFIAGQKERRLVLESLPVLTAAMPNALARVAPGVGHAWNGEAPGLFARVIRAWIGDAALPSELRPRPSGGPSAGAWWATAEGSETG